MDNITIPFSELPNLTENIKRVIGLSLWSLFLIRSDVEGAKYLLKTSDHSFLLDQDGSVIKVLEATDHINEISRVFFDGYSFPSGVKLNSISNSVCS